eukprot:scaffold2857_cov344-Pavlova_lutheri.AAC.8
MSSSLVTRIATGVPTGTLAVPAGARILARNPSSMVSISMVALSVSMSASTSPVLTASPSCFFQADTVPSTMVGLSAGMGSTSCGGSVPAANPLVWVRGEGWRSLATASPPPPSPHLVHHGRAGSPPRTPRAPIHATNGRIDPRTLGTHLPHHAMAITTLHPGGRSLSTP